MHTVRAWRNWGVAHHQCLFEGLRHKSFDTPEYRIMLTRYSITFTVTS